MDQVKYGDGKEESVEWHNIEQCLTDSDVEESPLNDDTRSSMSRRSLRPKQAPRWKKVNDLVYGNRHTYHSSRRRCK